MVLRLRCQPVIRTWKTRPKKKLCRREDTTQWATKVNIMHKEAFVGLTWDHRPIRKSCWWLHTKWLTNDREDIWFACCMHINFRSYYLGSSSSKKDLPTAAYLGILQPRVPVYIQIFRRVIWHFVVGRLAHHLPICRCFNSLTIHLLPRLCTPCGVEPGGMVVQVPGIPCSLPNICIPYCSYNSSILSQIIIGKWP